MMARFSSLFLLFASVAAVADVTFLWDAVTGAEIYPFFCEDTPLDGGPYTPLATPTQTQITVTDAQLGIGVEKECWVRAALADGSRESADSNHIVFANPGPYQRIQILSPPNTITVDIQ